MVQARSLGREGWSQSKVASTCRKRWQKCVWQNQLHSGMKTGDTHGPSHLNPPKRSFFTQQQVISHWFLSTTIHTYKPDFQMLIVETYKIDKNSLIVTGSPMTVFSWSNTEYFWFVMITSFQAWESRWPALGLMIPNSCQNPLHIQGKECPWRGTYNHACFFQCASLGMTPGNSLPVVGRGECLTFVLYLHARKRVSVKELRL